MCEEKTREKDTIQHLTASLLCLIHRSSRQEKKKFLKTDTHKHTPTPKHFFVSNYTHNNDIFGMRECWGTYMHGLQRERNKVKRAEQDDEACAEDN